MYWASGVRLWVHERCLPTASSSGMRGKTEHVRSGNYFGNSHELACLGYLRFPRGGSQLEVTQIEEPRRRDHRMDQPALGRNAHATKACAVVMASVYESGVTNTSALICRVHGHSKSVIDTVRALELSGILSRVQLKEGRRPVETRLILWGFSSLRRRSIAGTPCSDNGIRLPSDSVFPFIRRKEYSSSHPAPYNLMVQEVEG